MDRVRVIELTLWCFYAGWFSLIPILGLVPAALAYYLFWRVRAETVEDWNPAGTHLRCGLFLAVLGTGISLLIVAAIICQFL